MKRSAKLSVAELAEMKKERYAKDTRIETYERQEDKHKTYTLQVLGSVAVVAGRNGKV